ncbi:MAG TPA: penicillin-binding protein 2 [Persephonella sp.]|uniref:Division specific D,D-transpeptidase n=1 Tax=Persephonella marina (strain DSM 14350 / EX-H1) TaxID=123214 RepID=C0QP66_PERMH|nr:MULTISPECIES: penicillin-binding protein 2 [Persephonella]ACO04155.1 division specific D,D-transpeptidase [Persephonella marina EX-H1]HCB69922.1 penicillin-binding protein 2 [Persephonella sp.]
MNKTRVYIFSGLIIIGLLLVVLRLAYFQIYKRDEFLSYIQKQYYTKENIVLPRGTIFDSNGKILGISVPTISIYAIPRYIENKKEVAKNLSKILKIPERTLLKKLYNHSRYVVLAENVDKSLKPRIQNLKKMLKEWNIGIIESSIRYYPLKSVAGSTIGFVSRKEGIGLEGLEYKYNKILGGGIGKILLMKDATGNPFTIEKEIKKTDPKNLVLTIDSNIQYITEEILRDFVRERKPKEAAIIIMNPFTGEILANATYPTYDPNRYWLYRNHKNITFHSAYEPGSLAKPFVLAEAIDEGVVNFNRRYYCGEGKIVVDGKKIRDHKKFKMLTAEEIIIYSSNVGAIKLALKLDPKKFYKKLFSLGFGRSTKTFPGEASGILRPDYRPVQIAYASIGQSWTATPIQIALAYSAIANGGYLLKPRLVKQIVDPFTGEKKEFKKEVVGKVLSDKSLKKLREVLIKVVEIGTAKKGKSKYFTIAGKTGTAQKYDPKIKALSNEKFYTWFAGYFPAENPKFTVVIFANEPQKIYRWERIGGGSVSSPVLKALVDRLMFYIKEKPDKNGGSYAVKNSP